MLLKEFYIKAERDLPCDDYYEEYSQIENGVGLLTSLDTEIDTELEYIDEYLEAFTPPRSVSVVTGYAAYDHINKICEKLAHKVSGLEISVYPIKNNFFGENITVAGLLTATDIIEQLKGKTLGDELLFPACALRADGDLFLDDITPEELSEKLGVAVKPTGNEGAELIKNILGN